jgi:hypothetical protein
LAATFSRYYGLQPEIEAVLGEACEALHYSHTYSTDKIQLLKIAISLGTSLMGFFSKNKTKKKYIFFSYSLGSQRRKG